MKKPNIDDYRKDDDFPHKYIKDQEIWEQKNQFKIVKEGYVVITPTLCQGNVMAWSKHNENGIFPDVFATLKEAQLEILDTLEEHIRQFKNDEREWEEIDFDLGGDYVARYKEYEDGKIIVKDLELIGPNVILETTLEQWRADR